MDFEGGSTRQLTKLIREAVEAPETVDWDSLQSEAFVFIWNARMEQGDRADVARNLAQLAIDWAFTGDETDHLRLSNAYLTAIMLDGLAEELATAPDE